MAEHHEADLTDGVADSGDGRHETPLERLDRNWNELLSELRIALTGAQVLFAFLLVVPFNTGFARATHFERDTYFVTLALSALATALLITPTAEHRFLFRLEDKRHLVFVSSRLAIAGLALLALAIGGALMLVSTKLFGETAGLVTLGIAELPLGVLWFAFPLGRRWKLEREREAEGGAAEADAPPPLL